MLQNNGEFQKRKSTNWWTKSSMWMWTFNKYQCCWWKWPHLMQCFSVRPHNDLRCYIPLALWWCWAHLWRSYIFITCLSTRFTLLVYFGRNFLLFLIAKNSELLKCTKTFDDTSLGSGLFLLHNFLRQSRRPTLSTRDGSPNQLFSLKILSTCHPHNWWEMVRQINNLL